MLRRAHKGTFHKISPKHLQRSIDEFAHRHGIRNRDTLDQMEHVVARLAGQRNPTMAAHLPSRPVRVEAPPLAHQRERQDRGPGSRLRAQKCRAWLCVRRYLAEARTCPM